MKLALLRQFRTDGKTSWACQAIVVSAYLPLLFLAVRHEILGAMHGDTSVYLVVGRGILNGLVPYADLFDYKPPGIFLLSALSLKTTGGAYGLLLAEAVVVIAIPTLVASLHTDKLWGFAFGSALTLFVMQSAGNVGVESFGELFDSSARFSLVFCVLLVVLLVLRMRTSWIQGLFVGTALYIASVATLLGDGSGTKYFTIAAPFLLALFVSQRTHIVTKGLLMILPLSIGLSQFSTDAGNHTVDVEAAQLVDRIMEECGVERYVYMGDIGVWIPALMQHSPLGPAFFITDYSSRVEHLARSYEQNVKETQLILFQKRNRVLGSEKWVYDLTQDYVVEHFTTTPWPCVRTNLQTEEYHLLYRKGGPSATVGVT